MSRQNSSNQLEKNIENIFTFTPLSLSGTSLYYISLSLVFGNIDDRHRKPKSNIREIIWLGDLLVFICHLLVVQSAKSDICTFVLSTPAHTAVYNYIHNAAAVECTHTLCRTAFGLRYILKLS